ncbi:MAG: RHS repeat domain-containing protein, partial [Methylococcales bacterium]
MAAVGIALEVKAGAGASAGPNQLNTVSGPTLKNFSYDANGAAIADGANLFNYDGRGRLTSAGTALGTVSYGLNALGQRVTKTLQGSTTVFQYDLEGRLIGEYSSAAAPLREYLYLGDTPVLLIAGGAAYYIHSDHLNTPRLITNQANQIVWRWDSDPFGSTPANENPSGLGVFTNNLRFPGQFYDKETNLHQNYYRDYDPGTGRYPQSDPVGLAGGTNLYGYVNQNPVSFTDPTGEIAFLLPAIPPAIAVLGDAAVFVGSAALAGFTLNQILSSSADTPALQAQFGTIASPGNPNCPPDDPCKELRKRLQEHEQKLRDYQADPRSGDNRGFLGQGRDPQVIAGRIRSLQKQIANFRKLLE